MNTIVLVAIAVLQAGVLVITVLLLRRRATVDFTPVVARLDGVERAQEKAERLQREDMAQQRGEMSASAQKLREELATSIRASSESATKQLVDLGRAQAEQFQGFSARLDAVSDGTQRKLEGMRETIEQRLTLLQQENAQKLEQMRQTVDEQLQGTLEKRLGDSFALISERLEQVHRGLGEMQTLAAGVGDLKKVLSNVKVRGTWGEVQLGNLLAQVLSQAQYASNVCTRGDGNERVEFAIRLPGRGADDHAVWLPIDSKFPLEDYERLVSAAEAALPAQVEEASRQLETRVRACARDIAEKYVQPPQTTDFGIMFLPTEGLYAEVLRRPGLVASLQHDSRVIVAGPTTLWAILNSLQMGFRTLAIEQRSSEVWEVLGNVKTEFGKYADVLERVKKKLQEASNVVEKAQVRTRAIDRKLKGVEALPMQIAAGAEEDLLGHGVGVVLTPLTQVATLPAVPEQES